MKKVLLLVLGVVFVLGIVVGVRTVVAPSRQLKAETVAALPVDASAAARHLSEALRCKTVSYEDASRVDAAEFEKLHGVLTAAFPLAHAALKREVVNGRSLLYTWAGKDPSLAPILLLAHLDVVPAEEGGQAWSHGAFSGDITDGFVWGRGAVDDKGSLIAILEAVEALLKTGFAPARTVLLAFGQDEEIGGDEGAAKIAALLQERKIKPAFSLDEGMAVTRGIMPGTPGPLALVGIAEKGYASYELVVNQPGGHSSQPPKETAIDILSAALTRINAARFPARLDGPVRSMFDYACPEMTAPFRMLFRNLWLFQPLLVWQLGQDPATNATIRTTVASTIFHAGEKDNVLPATARAVVNCRLLPGDTVDGVLAHLQKAANDKRVEIKAMAGAENASPVTNLDSAGFAAVAKSIRQVWPEVAVAPCLDIGATDSRRYSGVVNDQCRFVPFWFNKDDLSMMHGVNERIEVKRLSDGIQFYGTFIRGAAG